MGQGQWNVQYGKVLSLVPGSQHPAAVLQAGARMESCPAEKDQGVLVNSS